MQTTAKIVIYKKEQKTTERERKKIQRTISWRSRRPNSDAINDAETAERIEEESFAWNFWEEIIHDCETNVK